jgi:hypothetical protein
MVAPLTMPWGGAGQRPAAPSRTAQPAAARAADAAGTSDHPGTPRRDAPAIGVAIVTRTARRAPALQRELPRFAPTSLQHVPAPANGTSPNGALRSEPNQNRGGWPRSAWQVAMAAQPMLVASASGLTPRPRGTGRTPGGR